MGHRMVWNRHADLKRRRAHHRTAIAVAALSKLTLGPVGGHDASAATSSNWPQFHNDLLHSGYNHDESIVGTANAPQLVRR
jgi:hypothetical protein